MGSGVSEGSATTFGVAVAVAALWSEPDEPWLATKSTSALIAMSVATSANANVEILNLPVKSVTYLLLAPVTTKNGF